jgi:hypothetical protein
MTGSAQTETLDDVNGEGLADEYVPPAAAPGVDVSELAGAIVQAVNAAQGPRKITAAEYMRTRSVHRDKPQLTRKIYQNGILLTRRTLTADGINFANAIQPGLYCDGTVQVVPMRDGATGVALDIRYENKTVDQRMALKTKFPTFEHMLAAILREQSAQ